MEKEVCDNCNREVPVANYEMHVAYCQRNIQPCPLCGEAISTSEEKEHFEEYHEEIACIQCGQKITRNEAENHQADKCGKQPVSCQFCEIMLPRERMAEHEKFCGSRTEMCSRCSSYVLIKHFKSHEKSCNGPSNCLLPCEFCGAMMPLDQLATHQRHCMVEKEGAQRKCNVPLLVEEADGSFSETEIQSGSRENDFPPPDPNKGNIGTNREETIVALPCEICGELCPSDRLMKHQEECVLQSESDIHEVLSTSGRPASDESDFRLLREQRNRIGYYFDHFTAEGSLHKILENHLQNPFGDLDERMWRYTATGSHLWPSKRY